MQFSSSVFLLLEILEDFGLFLPSISNIIYIRIPLKTLINLLIKYIVDVDIKL